MYPRMGPDPDPEDPAMHYDLYSSLGLSPSTPTSEIRQELHRRLANGAPLENLGGEEEVTVALAILGDPQKRYLYDSMLNDPTAPEITVDAIRELAELELNPGRRDASPSPVAAASPVTPPPPEPGRVPDVAPSAPTTDPRTRLPGGVTEERRQASPSHRVRGKSSWPALVGAGLIGVLVGAGGFWAIDAAGDSNGGGNQAEALLGLVGAGPLEEQEATGRQVIDDMISYYNAGDADGMLNMMCGTVEPPMGAIADYNGTFGVDELDIIEYSAPFNAVGMDRRDADSFVMSFRAEDANDGVVEFEIFQEASVIIQSTYTNGWCVSGLDPVFGKDAYNRNQPGQ